MFPKIQGFLQMLEMGNDNFEYVIVKFVSIAVYSMGSIVMSIPPVTRQTVVQFPARDPFCHGEINKRKCNTSF